MPVTLEEIVRRVLEAATPVSPEQTPLVEGLDRTLAEPIVSGMDLPPWDCSALDGYALRAAETAGASAADPATLDVAGEIRAGTASELRLEQGQAARIGVGARLPYGADAVVAVSTHAGAGPGGGRTAGQAAGQSGGRVAVSVPVEAGSGVRRQRSEVATGDVVVAAGTRLRPGHLSLIGAVGQGSIRVHCRPVACVLSVGDELRFPGQPLGAAGVPDANRPGLLTLCREAQAWAMDIGIASDSLDAVVGAVRPVLDRADLMLVTGGVSAAPYDVVARAFETLHDTGLGAVERWRLDGLAGRGFAFGVTPPRDGDGRRTLLFGLPGNPASAFAVFELVVRPVLDRLAGRGETSRRDIAVLAEPIPDDVATPAYVGVVGVRDDGGRLDRDSSGRPRVRLAARSDLEGVAALRVAEALAIVDEPAKLGGMGAEVEIRWLAE